MTNRRSSMVNLLITVTFLLTCRQEVFTDLRFEDFKRVMVEETAANSWSVNNVSSKLKCTSLCLADVRCSALAYQAPGTCLGFKPDKVSVMLNNRKTRRGFSIYFSEGRGVGIDERCTWDGPCRVNNSVCFKGRCKCTPGFSYTNSTNVCVRQCRKYGSTFSLYKELSIKEHNDETHLFHVAEKLERCMDKCVSETSFVCRSFDFKAYFGCYASSSGYLDVDKNIVKLMTKDSYLELEIVRISSVCEVARLTKTFSR